jgi:DNA-directed RNA polymerase subunit RPC12/RpoP
MYSLLFVLWWIVEFLNFAGRIGMDPLDVTGVAILAAVGCLALRAWQARCPRCGNRFFINSGLPLGFHLSSECPYCGQNAVVRIIVPIGVELEPGARKN